MKNDRSIKAEKERQQEALYKRLLAEPKVAKAEPVAVSVFAGIGSLVREKGKINFSK